MVKNIAVVGCGKISDIYLSNITNVFDNVCVYAVCDLDEDKAKEKSEKYDAEIMSLDEILQDKAVDIVLILTTPSTHYNICRKSIKAKKSVYVEKPLSVTYEEGAELVRLASENKVLLGCAPDTFMGAGIHTARKIIDDGLIGEIIGASAFMLSAGPESWHPSPEFYYKQGGGPLFDMGPYYLTALANLIGPVKSVMGMSNCKRKQRTITSEQKYGQKIDVDVDTHINALVNFENGATGNIIMSFDVFGSKLPKIEIYGTKGSLIVPDPNKYSGEVLLKQHTDSDFKPQQLVNSFSENSRGLGVSDMAYCLINGTDGNCANGKLALHSLEIMEKILESGEKHTEIEIISSFERPEISPIL